MTPVPGGVGPLTLGMLARNVVNQWMLNNNDQNIINDVLKSSLNVLLVD